MLELDDGTRLTEASVILQSRLKEFQARVAARPAVQAALEAEGLAK
jgi:hypothetical protein